MIPQLAPAEPVGAEMLAQLRGECEAILADNDSPIVIIASHSQESRTRHQGSFRAWGAPQVNVGAGHHLPELIARFMLGRHTSRVSRVVPDFASISTEEDPPRVIIVVIDGSTGLTDRAPSALLPSSVGIDSWCRELLSGSLSEPKTAEELEAGGVREPALWLEAAERVSQVRQARLVAADSSLGVGRYIAVWNIGEGQ